MGQKGRKKDVSPYTGRNLRIKFIHEFVCGEMGNQGAMLDFVNKKLKGHGLEAIGKSTLQADLSYLNDGSYLTPNERKKNKPFSDGKYFHAVLNKALGSYHYEDNIKPPLSFLTDEEQMTLPLLSSVLDPYSEVPAFQKFLTEAATLFDQKLETIQSNSAFAVTGPTFSFFGYKSRMITKVLQLLGHIKREEIITFEYLKSTSMVIRKGQPETLTKVTFKPLCIRLYQNLYYLTGIWEENLTPSLINYRVDLIQDESIKPILIDNNTLRVKTFSIKKEKSASKIEEVLKRSLGVWIHEDDYIVEKITLRFHGWAGKHLLTFDIHHSQKKITMEDGANYVDFEFKLFTYQKHLHKIEKEEQERAIAIEKGEINPQNYPYLPWLNRYPEAGYIFGRYINFIELIKIQQI
jgi:hypothetical protein